MSEDIEIVSQWAFRNPDAHKVPYGTVFADDDSDTEVREAGGGVTIESLYGEPAPNWNGLSDGDGSNDGDRPDMVAPKRRAGRPRKGA